MGKFWSGTADRALKGLEVGCLCIVGVEHCQARSEQKLHTHFNVALTAVSVAKAVYYLALPKNKRSSFSMADIKMLHMNQLMTNRIFVNLDLDLSDRKIKHLYNLCLNFGRLRA
ncbi:hypothetical protein OCK74_26130 [Chitinophagaceae bacterium LB-8]|uniref:Uncharacterized protein n=1 Tax=Paraflavisolibacter caeni TaxID=2982496 RepID=A0A9X2Y0W8_9BACT|nr:hypothetical protein [Paraflavisolibacter caeni]MCU7552625.1 hypothetical protein [Paraflavisolibacter caeni]